MIAPTPSSRYTAPVHFEQWGPDLRAKQAGPAEKGVSEVALVPPSELQQGSGAQQGSETQSELLRGTSVLSSSQLT